MSQNQVPTGQTRTLLTFSGIVIALALLIGATQVEMPLQAILIAVAFSEIIFVILIFLGKILPDKRR